MRDSKRGTISERTPQERGYPRLSVRWAVSGSLCFETSRPTSCCGPRQPVPRLAQRAEGPELWLAVAPPTLIGALHRSSRAGTSARDDEEGRRRLTQGRAGSRLETWGRTFSCLCSSHLCASPPSPLADSLRAPLSLSPAHLHLSPESPFGPSLPRAGPKLAVRPPSRRHPPSDTPCCLQG